MANKLIDETFSNVKQICDKQFIINELKRRDYDEQEIHELFKAIYPDAKAALEKMKDLMKRWEEMDAKK